MDIQPAIRKLVDDVEKSVNQKFRYRKEIESLFMLAQNGNQRQVMEDILFYAKFVTNASAVLSRVGMNSEETGKLAAEFKTNAEKVMTLLKTVTKEAPEEVRNNFVQSIFSPTQAGMNNFIALLKELTCFKNYSIDHHGLL